MFVCARARGRRVNGSSFALILFGGRSNIKTIKPSYIPVSRNEKATYDRYVPVRIVSCLNMFSDDRERRKKEVCCQEDRVN